MRGIDHQTIRLTGLAGKGLENSVEYTEFAPTNEAIIQRLVRAIFLWRVFPLKSMFQHINYATDNTPVINAWYAMRQWELGPDPAQLRRRQPKQITHGKSSCNE